MARNSEESALKRRKNIVHLTRRKNLEQRK